MKEIRVQAVSLPEGAEGGQGTWCACECSACGPIALTVAALVNDTCQEHLREHGAVGITKQ